MMVDGYSPSFYRSAKKNIFHVNEMDDSEVYFHVSCIGGGKLQICVLWI